jgi:pimeloyl-ACP methyl ester carboxylesterase
MTEFTQDMALTQHVEAALARPELVRRLLLVGTGPRGGEGVGAFPAWVAELFTRKYERHDGLPGGDPAKLAGALIQLAGQDEPPPRFAAGAYRGSPLRHERSERIRSARGRGVDQLLVHELVDAGRS